MKHRLLGKKGPSVSALGLGCMAMAPSYGAFDDKTSLKVIQNAFDKGTTFFDTADMYGNGANEKLLGGAIQPFRNEIVIATKCGIRIVGNDHVIDNTAEYIKQACEKSLQRLGIEQIDLYYLHRHNPVVPLEESMHALLDLTKEGKVKHIGLSEVGPEILQAAHAILGDKLVALQSEYSIANFKPAESILPLCRKLGIGFVAYSPLSRGLLSGKIRDTKVFSESEALDFRGFLPQFQAEILKANLHLVEAIEKIAKTKHCTPAQLSLAWLLAQGEDIIPIPGTKNLNYLKENIDSVDISLSEKDLQLIAHARDEHPIQGARYPEALMKIFNLEA